MKYSRDYYKNKRVYDDAKIAIDKITWAIGYITNYKNDTPDIEKVLKEINELMNAAKRSMDFEEQKG